MKTFFEYTLVVFSILTSGSLLYTSFNDDMFLILYFLLCLTAFFLKRQQKLSKYYFYYALLCISFLLLHPFLINNINIINIYFGYSLRIVSFLFVISVLGYQNFSLLYVKIMLFLCCANLFIYVDQNFLYGFSDPLASLSRLLTTWDQNVFYENYIFYAKPIKGTFGPIVESGLIRNNGIFGEGGAYQYFLNLALVINLYSIKRPVFSFSNWIFVISILTTFSTTGYIILIIVLAYTTFGKSYERHMYMKRLIILPFIILILISSTVIVDKLFNQESQAFLVSTQRRILDNIVDYHIIKDNPIFGIGFGNDKTYKIYSNKFLGGGSSSNSLLYILSSIGIIGFLITLYPFIKFDLKKKKNKMIFLCNFLTILTQGWVIFTPVFLLSMSLLNQKDRIA